MNIQIQNDSRAECGHAGDKLIDSNGKLSWLPPAMKVLMVNRDTDEVLISGDVQIE
ncbi:hypothetical protein NP590_13080 [Methylomonas sp. SURF-2]|uniref:Uncharacterized protein n=1 Tax=Methylomonas subterranea TaxID=2952225 RepID=A0ABT1THW5_9GAMM|nr:hypothetical protein [Methylomonas sp. SURF-2]MCQ8105043.1 hypothetical protein [Methylomonas sp. SURF-2]